jgi:fatty acid amide hydrolase 2
MSQCVGSLKRCGIKADEDSEAVKLIRKAGAIPLLVSNTPEFCLSWETNNLVTGRTCNPYNFLRTSGGSSGGEVRCKTGGKPWLLVVAH